MSGLIVLDAVTPAPMNDAKPFVCKSAVSLVSATAFADLLVVVGLRPSGEWYRLSSPFDDALSGAEASEKSVVQSIRAQYHLRRTEQGIDAWDVRRLVALSEGFDVQMVNPGRFAELDEDHWYFDKCRLPTPRSILEHMRLIEQCDLRYPIILDSTGRVMDGMHRVCKALLHGVDALPAVQFEVDPEPDYENCDPTALPYDD